MLIERSRTDPLTTDCSWRHVQNYGLYRQAVDIELEV